MICPKCGYAMDSFDRECPRCHGKGVEASKPTTSAPTTSTPSTSTPSTSAPTPPHPVASAAAKSSAEKTGESCAKIGCGCFGLLVAFIIFSRIFFPGDGKKGDTYAYVLARHSIQQQLKAPTTAKFPGHWEPGVGIVERDNVFYIASYVDAQNSFGAMIRQKWVAAVQRSPDGKEMTLLFANLKSPE